MITSYKQRPDLGNAYTEVRRHKDDTDLPGLTIGYVWETDGSWVAKPVHGPAIIGCRDSRDATRQLVFRAMNEHGHG